MSHDLKLSYIQKFFLWYNFKGIQIYLKKEGFWNKKKLSEHPVPSRQLRTGDICKIMNCPIFYPFWYHRHIRIQWYCKSLWILNFHVLSLSLICVIISGFQTKYLSLSLSLWRFYPCYWRISTICISILTTVWLL